MYNILQCLLCAQRQCLILQEQLFSEMHNCFREGEREEMEIDFVEDITLARKPDVCVVQYLLLILLLLVYIDFLQDG